MKVQVSLFQKHVFWHQLTHIRWIIKLRVQYIKITSSQHVVYTNYAICFFVLFLTVRIIHVPRQLFFFEVIKAWKFHIVSAKVIIGKSRGGRFLWNRNWDLGWIWAGWATFEAGFFKFSWAKTNFKKQIKNIVASALKWCI